MFSTLTTCYLFIGGAGAGALVILGSLEFANLHRHSVDRTSYPLINALPPNEHSLHIRPIQPRNRLQQAFALPEAFFSYGWPLCFIALSLGVLCLTVDLGRPDRILGLLIHPQLSALSVGSYALVLSLVCSGIFCLLSLLETPSIPPIALYALIALSLLSGIVTMTYTGILLQSMASILQWQTPLLPLIFVLSSLSCGIAITFIGAAFIEARYPFVNPIIWLCRIDTLILLVEAICLVFYLLWGFSDPQTLSGTKALITGELRWLFWLGVVVFGFAIPLVMERFVSHGNYRVQLLWIGAFILAGGFILRICIVGIAAYDVTQIPDLLYTLAAS